MCCFKCALLADVLQYLEVVHTCFVLLARSAGLLDKLAPAALLLSAGRKTLGRSNVSSFNLGKPL